MSIDGVGCQSAIFVTKDIFSAYVLWLKSLLWAFSRTASRYSVRWAQYRYLDCLITKVTHFSLLNRLKAKKRTFIKNCATNRVIFVFTKYKLINCMAQYFIWFLIFFCSFFRRHKQNMYFQKKYQDKIKRKNL